MKLVECYIENFGRLSDKSIKFTDGLNAFLGDNGEGKTTLTVFIKAMLYGIGDTKKTSLDENDRKHYLPWDGRRAGGTLTFSAGGGVYRIERTFGKKASDDTFAIFDTRLGRETAEFREGVGAQLFGIDVKGFERTVFLSERNLTPESDHTSITEKLSELVGTDGNVGIIDKALDILDDQRKFYRKKGGGGAIADTRAELSAIEDELENVCKAEKSLAEATENLADLQAERIKLAAEKEGLSARREALRIRQANAGYEERLSILRAELDEAVRRKDRVISFFSGGVPSADEIDEIKYKMSEARRLLSEGGGESHEDAEYRGLREYFNGKVTAADIDRARADLASAEIESNRAPSPEEERARRAFLGMRPDAEKIEKIKEISKKKVSWGFGRGMLIFGIIALLCGICLGLSVSAQLYFVCAAGATLMLVGIIGLSRTATRKKKLINELHKLIVSLPASDLYTKMPPPEAAEELLSLYPMLSEESNGIHTERILSFLDKFDARGYTNPLSYAREIIIRYDRYSSLHVGREFRAEAREESARRARELESEVREFLDNFKVTTTDPIGEIRRNLTELNRLTEAIRSRRQDIASFSAVGASVGATSESNGDTEELLGEGLTRVETRLYDIDRETATTEKQRARDSELVGERDTLLSRRAQALDTLEEYEKNLATIQLTEKYLKKAGESITSKYLGKTRTSFIKYSSMISGDNESELEIDTSFAASRREGALTRSTESYSRGMRDMYRLSARLALIDSLYESEAPFIILDDPFASFDDGKVRAALSLVERLARDRQIIYFTCSRSRAIDKSRKI